MRVTTEIDTAGQVKQPLPQAPHDIQVAFGSKLRIVTWNKGDDIEGVDRPLLESISRSEIHLGVFFTSMAPKSFEMVLRVDSIYTYFRKVSLEDCDEHEKELDGYTLIFAARCSGRLGYAFPSNFDLGGKSLFKSPKQIIAALQFKRDFQLEEKDYGVVRDDSDAQVIYAVACLLESNYSPPNGLQQDGLLEVFDQFIRRLDHQSTS
ncbi:hypothetical protein HZS61_003153 [Fusarium oxysporum f. sp. conglutinans]|uniref:Uncharacterized protein n=1 Tax=Fusarium oxysporum f. sp. conglutinans TaxID=100902 RepID=A0A8H6LEK2_FUSOX|nr:hypothetical protein HZS61_003153 [Fusarium oxysporum f. sp. conglutinans]